MTSAAGAGDEFGGKDGEDVPADHGENLATDDDDEEDSGDDDVSEDGDSEVDDGSNCEGCGEGGDDVSEGEDVLEDEEEEEDSGEDMVSDDDGDDNAVEGSREEGCSEGSDDDFVDEEVHEEEEEVGNDDEGNLDEVEGVGSVHSDDYDVYEEERDDGDADDSNLTRVYQALVEAETEENHAATSGAMAMPVQRIAAMVEKHKRKKLEWKFGGAGTSCPFTIAVRESWMDGGGVVVEISHIHEGHVPAEDNPRFRAPHPCVENYLTSLIADRDIRTARLVHKGMAYAKKYERARRRDYEEYERTGKLSHQRTTSEGNAPTRSPLRLARSYGDRSKTLLALRQRTQSSPPPVPAASTESVSDSSMPSPPPQPTRETLALMTPAERTALFHSCTKRAQAPTSTTQAAGVSSEVLVAAALVPSMTDMPHIFSNYNWHVTPEYVGCLKACADRIRREGRSAMKDIIYFAKELERAGWAISKSKQDNGKVIEMQLFIQSPMQKEWVKKYPGIADVVQIDDTHNITAWNLPFFAFVGRDPVTATNLPLAFAFSKHEATDQGKTRAMAKLL